MRKVCTIKTAWHLLKETMLTIFTFYCRYYSFTEFACQLNEMEEGIAPTDSRLRPDQRLMEEGHWERSNAEKMR